MVVCCSLGRDSRQALVGSGKVSRLEKECKAAYSRSEEVKGLKEQQSEVTNIRIVLRAGYFDGEVTGVWYNLVGLGWCSVYNSHVADVFSLYSAYCTNNAGI